MKPFFDQYLKPGAPKADTPGVFIYNTGENHWDRFPKWPLSCEKGCPSQAKPLYLTGGFGLSFTRARRGHRHERRRLRRVRLRPGQAGALPAAAGALRRRRPLADLAALAISARSPTAPTCSAT